MKPLTDEWVQKADGDLTVADAQMQSGSLVHDVVCFLCQQVVEKYRKAWLTEQGIAFPRTHDLEALARLCAMSLPDLVVHMHDLRYLTSFGVEVRYPGTTARPDDATRAVTIAHIIESVVRARIM